ncbi:2-keto-4-pentenoate hydratase [Arthrobacter sp. KK5.5]|uniref:2-keto-4-pentenoate hydratase n=1 Tax=Arthrobacter sp. KK5.5 TaxID=3373084 RepID=UPI003EE6415F
MAWTIDTAAEYLLGAERSRTDVEPLTDEWPELDAETGYAIQDRLIALRLSGGERVVGVKLGLTSRAKQERMGIESPLTAVVTDAMRIPAGAPAPYGRLIHPRVEPEIVFRLGKDLRGPDVDIETALAAVATVHAGFEIIDSRFRDFRFRLPDVIADNASSSYFVVSEQAFGVGDLDLAAEEVVVKVDGREVDRATGAAVQGHPAAALALAANSLARRGITIPAGSLVLTGGLTDAVAMSPDSEFAAEFATLGSVVIPAGR